MNRVMAHPGMHDSTELGIAFLADPSSSTSKGTACLAAGKSFDFSNVSDLRAHNALWITNLQHSTFVAEGLSQDPRFAHLRSAAYFPTPITALAQEMGASGVPGKRPTVLAVLPFLAEIVKRVVQYGDTLSSAVPDQSLDLGAATFAEALYRVVQPAGMDINRLAAPAISSLLHPPIHMGAASARDVVFRVPANRYQLMRSVFASGLPAGHWTEVDLTRFPTAKSALSWAMATHQMALVQVVMKGIKSSAKEFGGLVRNISQGSLRWMTLHEVAVLSSLMDMEPKAILVSEHVIPLESAVRIPGFACSPVGAAAVSVAVFSEALLHAHAFGMANPSTPSTTRPVWRCRAAYAAWVTSLSRSRMTQAASSLARFGYSVIGVSTSSILVACHRRQLASLRKDITGIPLLSYPMGLRSMEEVQQVVRTESHENLGAVQ